MGLLQRLRERKLAKPRSLDTIKKLIIVAASRVGINKSAALAGLSGLSKQHYRIRLALFTGETLLMAGKPDRQGNPVDRFCVFRDDPRLVDGRLVLINPLESPLIGGRFDLLPSIPSGSAPGTETSVNQPIPADPTLATVAADKAVDLFSGPSGPTGFPTKTGGSDVGLSSALTGGLSAVGKFVGDVVSSDAAGALIEAGVGVGTLALTQKIGSGSSSPGGGGGGSVSNPFGGVGSSFFERDAAGDISGIEGFEFGDVARVGEALSRAFFPTISKYTGAITGARAMTHVEVNPVTGKPTFFKPAGEVALWTSDFAAARKVKRLAAKASRGRRKY